MEIDNRAQLIIISCNQFASNRLWTLEICCEKVFSLPTIDFYRYLIEKNKTYSLNYLENVSQRPSTR